MLALTDPLATGPQDPSWLCSEKRTMQVSRSLTDMLFCWFLQFVYRLVVVQSFSRCSTLHQTEGWTSAEATHMQILNGCPLSSLSVVSHWNMLY